VLASSTGFGQARDPAAARTLFNEGRTLVNQGHYDQACPKFEESMRLDNGIGTRFNLADCWEHIGRNASAWSLFLDVAAGAKSSAQADREKVARERAAALEPRLSRLTIRVQANDPGVEVRKNDAMVGRALFGTPTPVDPGAYTVEARAPGKKSWITTVTIAANTRATTVVVPELETETVPKVAAPTPAPAGPTTNTIIHAEANSDVAADSGRASNGQRTVAWIIGTAGLVGVGVGAAFAALTKSADSRAATLCVGGTTGNQCSNDAERLEFEQTTSKAKNRAIVSYVGLIGGGAAVVTGAILLFTAGSGGSAPARGDRKAVLTPTFGPDVVGISFSSVW
jgi:hypothetical protein